MRLTTEQSRVLFTDARVLRLATADAEGRPHLVPATFAIRGDVIGIAVDHKPKTSTRLKRLRNVESNPAVSLLVDHYSDDWDALWWVRADGAARVAAAADEGELVSILVDKYPQYQEVHPAGSMMVIEVSRWSGWQARAA
ncbi:TIGR03668 family PPOX class F420-dependent oxidoreductase [Streptomyces sp. Z26]|uniref:TIGR03668 family PPOX class F420-dependent oxidoreductase n=1 Tax=Streptomyces sp. Z26 TaxID=2500177 RepID=UPI000EF144DA|nr:TIGR03668 family PPOX class F420-dependent oxidoreductase [Streptomyces sp. Z26]RLL67015.1 TIGR03668 family PPOX class F420-dependent oxidoreductase [Streptomyces sp. Z26]